MTPALYNGGASAVSTDADSIVIVLHNATSPFAQVYSSSNTLLQTNGNAVFTLPGEFYTGNYYIEIRTRNHLATWSKFPVTLGTSTIFDFSTP
jgi:hypothetical protein